MAAVTVKVNVRFVWHGDRVVKNIVRGSARGITKAVDLYYKTLTQRMEAAGWGSIPFSSSKFDRFGPGVMAALGGVNLRLRIKHSPPGAVPLIQTRNLLNSIKKSFSFGKQAFGSRVMIFIGRISSSVSYAVALERGGLRFTKDKKFTNIRLVNPLKKNITIAKRPVWLPVFQQIRAQMQGLINKELAKALKGL